MKSRFEITFEESEGVPVFDKKNIGTTWIDGKPVEVLDVDHDQKGTYIITIKT